MAGGLRYETGRKMPPGMQELYAVQEVVKMVSDGQITKEAGKERIATSCGLAMIEENGEEPEKMPFCGDAPEREDLPGCPFCSSENLLIDRDSEGWFVECNGCLAEGPRAETQAEAERRWARRF